MFKSATTDFKGEVLKKYIDESKDEEAKSYVLQYFAKVGKPAGVMLWSPSINELIWYTKQDIINTYLLKSYARWITPPKGRPYCDFSITNWFFEENHTVYFLKMEADKQGLFDYKDRKFINLFGGYMHTNPKAFASYSDKIRENVATIWRHVNEVWCSKNKNTIRIHTKVVSLHDLRQENEDRSIFEITSGNR